MGARALVGPLSSATWEHCSQALSVNAVESTGVVPHGGK